jgi:hypothetical protein
MPPSFIFFLPFSPHSSPHLFLLFIPACAFKRPDVYSHFFSGNTFRPFSFSRFPRLRVGFSTSGRCFLHCAGTAAGGFAIGRGFVF